MDQTQAINKISFIAYAFIQEAYKKVKAHE
jgi:hypothetical protein